MNIKLGHEEKIYFGSDFHLNHDRPWIYKYRHFENIQDHDNFVVASLRELPEDSTLIYLGDFSLNSSEEKTIDLFNQIKVKKIYYIFGNHESYTTKIVTNNKTPPHVTFCGHYAEFDHKKYGKIVCTHFPLAVWHQYDYGAWHLHGHCHGNFADSLEECKISKRLDVGIDVVFRYWNKKYPFDSPRAVFSIQEIQEIMATKQVKILDHHGKDINTFNK